MLHQTQFDLCSDFVNCCKHYRLWLGGAAETPMLYFVITFVTQRKWLPRQNNVDQRKDGGG